ncbi:RluA family pseudouridine synthase [Candidatus Gracilibacteria bacterium]|nr:RluA family pseudouridine synthase [Candidatus Gracilibacteria bacterium]
MIIKFCVFSEKKLRVDIYLSALFSDFSRSYIQKIIDKGQVCVNGKIISKNLKISPKDELQIEIIPEKLEILPQKMDLDIIFEDENILIINKDSGINVHPVPGEGGRENTLVNGILYHCSDKNDKKRFNLGTINGVERPGIVHRLDKDTSGIILIAKNDSMMNYLAEIIKNRKITKKYFAIVNGIVKDKEFQIESYIGRDSKDRKKMTTKNPINPKIAISEIKVLDYIDEKYSLLEVKILTGRTHQIRVHLASIGFPILGDQVYGNSKVNLEVFEKYGLKRQALHSKSLEFELYGKNRLFEAELKNDMKKFLK